MKKQKEIYAVFPLFRQNRKAVSRCTKVSACKDIFTKRKRSPRMIQIRGDVAETVGFEPTDRLITSQTISSRSRYDHFDTSPCRTK